MDIEWTKLKTYKNKKQHFIPHLRYRCEKIFKERHGINPWIYQSKRRQQSAELLAPLIYSEYKNIFQFSTNQASRWFLRILSAI